MPLQIARRRCPLNAEIMNVAAKGNRALSACGNVEQVFLLHAIDLVEDEQARDPGLGELVEDAPSCRPRHLPSPHRRSERPHRRPRPVPMPRRPWRGRACGWGAKMPGVSMKMSWLAPSMAMPRTGTRVVCALRDTIVTLAPTSALTSVDLPAFGAPTMAMKPQRCRLRADDGVPLSALFRHGIQASRHPHARAAPWRRPARRHACWPPPRAPACGRRCEPRQ